MAAMLTKPLPLMAMPMLAGARAPSARRVTTVVVRAEPESKSLTEQADAAFAEATAEAALGDAAKAEAAAAKTAAKSGDASELTDLDRELIAQGGLADAMRFKGAAPEIVNGRLAMLGFVTAILAEAASGKTMYDQYAMASGPILLTFIAFIGASFVPILKGTKAEATKFGPFTWTPEAELLNGRAAMVGFLLLMVIDGGRWFYALQTAKAAAMMLN